MKKGLRLASFPLKFVRKGPFMRNDDFQDACPRGESLAILSSEMAGDPDSEEGCSWLRALVAFANTQGGSLCVGMDSRTRMAKPLSKEEAGQLAQRQYKFIQNLEAALVRIENKTYGVCRMTGKLIPKERLRLVPHATLTVEAKEMMNKNK